MFFCKNTMLDQSPDDFNGQDIRSQGRKILIQGHQFESHLAGIIQTFRAIFPEDQFFLFPTFCYHEIARFGYGHRIENDPVAFLKDRLHGIARYLKGISARGQIRMSEQPAQRITQCRRGSRRIHFQCLIRPNKWNLAGFGKQL